MYPWCSHLFPASLCPVSTNTASSCDNTVSADISGGWGQSAWTTSSGQWSIGWAGSGLGRCRSWVPLTLWDCGPGSVSGTPPIPVSAARWRAGGMHWWLGYVFCWWWWRLCSSPRLARGSMSNLHSSPGVVNGWPVKLPPALHHMPLCSSSRTPFCILACCDNKPSHRSWSMPVSLGWSRQYVPPRWTAQYRSPGRCRCWGSQEIVSGGK